MAQPTVTLVEGSSFCVSGPSGEIELHRPDGLFVRDTRIVSYWQLHIDGALTQALAVIPGEPYECTFVGRTEPRNGNPDTTVIVERHRFVGEGMREDITLRNFGNEAAGMQLALRVDADFADLFQVKEQRILTPRAISKRASGSDLAYWVAEGLDRRGVRISAPDGRAVDNTLLFTAVVPPRGTWTTRIEVIPSIGGDEFESTFPLDRPVESTMPAARMRGWRAAAPRFDVEHPTLSAALEWSQRDLGALRIIDPEHPDDAVVAAGAPWFMALFGRDSLLTSLMTLPYLPELAIGTLRALARLQGTTTVPMTEEEPGRILHEVRVGADLTLALGGDRVYYGSIDSTALFVMLAGSIVRWGTPMREMESILPAVDAALEWLLRRTDGNGDGFVEYERATDRGLLNQGWKDSHDGINFADGTHARPPIALAEVQGYTYAAFLAKADLQRAAGDERGSAVWRERANALKQRFHEAYWIPDRGYYAVALDRHKQQVDSATSNLGQCLWTGIVDESVAPQVAATLMSPALFSGWGVRTLSEEAAAFNPVSYHNGSVWPHDSMLAAAGLARYGFAAEADRVMSGLLDACERLGGTLPELFCGFSRAEKHSPVPYPTSCSPQAWAAAVPFQLLTTAINLGADVPGGVVWASPAPPSFGTVAIDGLELGGSSVSIRATADDVSIDGLPAGVRFERRPR